jgi:hypothetical protein
MLALLLLSSSYPVLASRAPLAGVCLVGLVGTQARLIVQLLVFCLGAMEIFVTFS